MKLYFQTKYMYINIYMQLELQFLKIHGFKIVIIYKMKQKYKTSFDIKQLS